MAKAYVKHDYAVTGRDYVETEGGGDTPAGMFIDTSNIIQEEMTIPAAGLSYTASEDCYVYLYLWGGRSTAVKINDVEINANYSNDKYVCLIPLKKDQVLTTTSGNENNTYKVLGIQ